MEYLCVRIGSEHISSDELLEKANLINNLKPEFIQFPLLIYGVAWIKPKS